MLLSPSCFPWFHLLHARCAMLAASQRLPMLPSLLRCVLQVDEARYHSAQGVAAELQAAMRAALADGYVFVLPTTPGPAPQVPAASQASGAAEVDAFRQRCRQFAAVASLSGVPQAVLPLPVPDGMPLSVSLLALHKRDLALLQAAAKLGSMLEEEAAALAAQQAAGPPAPWQPQAAAAAAASGSGAAAAVPRSSGDGGAKRRGTNGAEAARAAEAEARKEEGNAAFRAGRYEEAARQYSAALQLDPRCAVYWANRAMAYLKLGSYGAAEADCDEALKLELSAKALLRRGSARLAQVRMWGVGRRGRGQKVGGGRWGSRPQTGLPREASGVPSSPTMQANQMLAHIPKFPTQLLHPPLPLRRAM